MVREVKVPVSVEPLTVTACPLGLAVTVYAVIADPPVDDGALHVTVACVLPAVEETLIGAAGIVAGVMALDGMDAVPLPTLFIAMTVNE